jgi:molybdate transport system ATP-binding protein
MLQVSVKKIIGDKRSIGLNLDASFEVENGITVLLGASGSGKTTLLKLISGILTPDEGIIKVGTETYFESKQRIDLPVQKRRVGYVFQNYALFPHLTAVQNIAYGVRCDSANKLEKAKSILKNFRLSHLEKRLPREMSGGEQQRIALARALASDPAIVLLDEPLSAVDITTRVDLLNEIDAAQQQANVPFIYVTHNEMEASRLAKRRITLEQGKIVSLQ